MEKNVFQVLSFHRVFLLCVFHRHTNVKMAHIPDTILLQVCVYECVRPHWPLQRRPSLWSVYPLGQMQWWEPGRLTHCHSHPPSRHSFTSVCGHKQEAQTFDVSWRNLFFFFTYLHTPPWELVQLNSQVLSFVASCTQVDTRQCSCVRLRLRYARICRSIGTIPVSCGTAPYMARAPD